MMCWDAGEEQRTLKRLREKNEISMGKWTSVSWRIVINGYFGNGCFKETLIVLIR